ncbi:histidinol-phosphate transaminase [Streptomyces hawaiiensis]|uniref:histidinol-phosphate transaminase n=1 Tax=Streptomyces hawaiiensis TaxID=67305 RepID=UPI0036603E0A
MRALSTTRAAAPVPRGALEDLPDLARCDPSGVPGGPVAHRLAANENPYAPLPGVLEAATAAAAGLNRYPDMTCAALTRALAEKLELPVSRIAVGPGSVGVAQALMQAMCAPGDEVVFAWPSFDAYPVMARIAGATAVPVPLGPGQVHDLTAMARAVTGRTRMVLVCNPNNPTGTVVHRAELLEFLDRVPREVLVVVDEAYHEFVRDPGVPDGVELHRDHPNVAVLRTFSKAYGLAGLRVGYAVAHEPVAAALRKAGVPFAVSRLAEDAAVASLLSTAALGSRVDTLTAERERVRDALLSLGRLPRPPGSQANFLWLALGKRSVSLRDACAAAGVEVRCFPGEGVRVTIGAPASNDLFLAVAEKWASMGA